MASKSEKKAASPKAGGAPAKAAAPSGGSSSKIVVAASLVAVAAAVGYGQLQTSSGGLDRLLQYVPRQLTSTFESVSSTVASVTKGKVADKYTTDIVREEPRIFLPSKDQCTDATYTPSMLSSDAVSVIDAMEGPAGGSDKVFFMLNGQNEGLYVSWNGNFDCLASAAESAAKWLGADVDEITNGVRLYSQLGMPVRNAAELKATKNIVHILLDFQIWQWPGIKKGYKYVLDNGVTLTTVGMSPKVLDVEHFFTDLEANQIIELGSATLNRSKVDGSNSSSVVSKSRTSHTAFLEDGDFTRDFRRRSAQVARLPSPSYAERLQLVRYAAGEFYRQHLDTFHSREFLPKGANLYSMDDYTAWATWAATKLRELGDDPRVPEQFREGGSLFPNPEDQVTFPNAFLDVFYHDAVARNAFVADFDEEWATWIRTNVDKGASKMMPAVMKADGKPHYLPFAVRAWEKKLGIRELFYTFPKKPVNGVTQFFRWVRWAKERMTFLGDEAPVDARPSGKLFPKYTVKFQDTILGFILDDYSADFVTRVTNAEWYKWLVDNRGRNHVLFEAMQVFPNLAELAIRAWESRVGAPASLRYTMPKYVRHFHPQRFVTLFLYLNNQTKVGGETVFPHSLDRFTDEKIERTGMDECSQGLAVPPRGLHASLFYVQTPEGEVDKMSRHGGCPPHEGIKWGSNSFMWNADADEGADLWTTK